MVLLIIVMSNVLVLLIGGNSEMKKFNRHIFSLLIAFATLGVIASGSVYAGSRGGVPGYMTDSEGNILVNSEGDCVHTGSWIPEMATIVGCDGVTVDKSVELIVGQPSGLLTNVTIPAASMFAFNSADLTDEGKAAIDSYRDQLRLELSKAYAVVILGFTDNSGDPDYNVDLSERRANAVRDYLISTGVNPDLLRTVGLGDMYPIASNDTAEGRAMNRRVQVEVIAEARALDMLRFPSAILFQRRSADITKAGEQSLVNDVKDSIAVLKRATYIEVVGHTDDVGDDAYNLNLSRMRAEVVKSFLVKLGLNPHKIVAVGAGEDYPIADNNTPEGRAENRRVEILVLGRIR
jgi:outer membrane protein OmpA-like peptidoglycan-associated protein